MQTLIPQAYNPELGYTIPPSIEEAGVASDMRDICDETTELFYRIQKNNPIAAEYVLTNAHKRRVSSGMNMRELYAFSRLREDAHAQWDIRNIAHDMVSLVKDVAPASSLLLCGKDAFRDVRASVYGGDE